MGMIIPILLAAQAGGGVEVQLEIYDPQSLALPSFGLNLDIAGDVNADGFADIIVGSRQAAAGGLTYAGAAYVYSGVNGALLFQIDGNGQQYFMGDSVAGAGDVNDDGFDDFIVGEPGNDVNRGAAYVYSGENASLLYQLSGVAAQDRVGVNVFSAGDVNSDGYDDFIIGQDSGELKIYSGFNGLSAYSLFGDKYSGVSSIDDINGDGHSDILVGERSYASTGRVIAYSGIDGTLLYSVPGVLVDSRFGESVDSLGGDIDGDGIHDWIVGAPQTSAGGGNATGLAYLFSGATGNFIESFSGEADGDRFGGSVSGVGDVDGMGVLDFAVGAEGAEKGYIFSGETSLRLYDFPDATNPNFYGFGQAIAGGGDVNGDGSPDVLFHGFSASGEGVFSVGFERYITCDITSVSTVTGGNVNIALDFPDSAAFSEYKVLMSLAGTGPSFYGVNIPLTLDSYVVDTFYENYPFSAYTNLHGTLDATGDTICSATFPSGIPPAAIGITLYLAAVANPVGQLPDYSSVAWPIMLTL
ncbi:MAG: energy-converting hydrogenase Eha subunit B [Myxococcota bacterium]|jgi:energy-converting hydrogenase Eha subunit B